MRVFLVCAGVACGPGIPQEVASQGPSEQHAIAVQWKVENADAEHVEVTLVVEGKPHTIGLLPSVIELQAGTETCALRAAHMATTELTCGDLSSYFAAQLVAGELVVSRVDPSGRHEVTRIPAEGDGLSVRALTAP